ncbi:hypothetical protein F8M41_020510 [Gigaspora margarita]|uniref:Uncharacterized protein n=1 Tax=Gigaspora margarita TaxID=4874 RepID=A0A8H4EJN1_GIGMA|nr:hypothetical protein F8M41_020510 [Gigaspora margarita]
MLLSGRRIRVSRRNPNEYSIEISNEKNKTNFDLCWPYKSILYYHVEDMQLSVSVVYFSLVKKALRKNNNECY